MGANIFWKPDKALILDFMHKYVKDFDEKLDYSNWHYVKDFTKNCKYMSDEYFKDIELMNKLNSAIDKFQLTYYPTFDDESEEERIVLSNKPTIFLYWHQGKDCLPSLQQLCYDRLNQKCSNDFNIILLDRFSIKDYISIPDFIENAMQEKRMWLQHYVDYIRISLLAKYKAIWFDATVFVKDDLKDIDFDYDFWSIKCKDMYVDTWAKDVIPQMNKCQIYAMGGNSSYFYKCMKSLIEYHFKHFNVAYSYYIMYYMAEYLYKTNRKIKQQFDDLDYNNEHVECFTNKRALQIEEIKKMWNCIDDTHIFKLLKFDNANDAANDAYKIFLFCKDIYEKDKEQ